MPEIKLGELECPSIDVEQFKSDCRAPVYPDLMNHWLLVRTDVDNPSTRDVKVNAETMMAHWFSRWGAMGRIDNVKVGDPVRGKPKPRGIVKTANSCKHPINVRTDAGGAGPWFVPVDFAYRGSDKTVPWPVWKDEFLGGWCPAGADWALFAVERPGEDAPKEKGGWVPTLPSLPSVPDIRKDIRTGATIATVLVLVAVGAGVAYAGRSKAEA